MVSTYSNHTTTSTVINKNTVPHFESLFAHTAVGDSDIIKYPISLSLFTIISDTPLPNSPLRLTHGLIAHKEITKDGYVIKSSYIDEESFGSTLEEAYLDFLTSVRDKYNSLQRREAKLSTRDKIVLNNIRSLLS
ncbi:hypothetical protein ACFLYR_09170 [Chloroflexota bacterium]